MNSRIAPARPVVWQSSIRVHFRLLRWVFDSACSHFAAVVERPFGAYASALMSMDRSLKSANSLIRHRNVLTRTERLEKLAEEEKWDPSKSVFGLPKVEHRKQAIAKAAKEEAAAEGAEGAAAT